MNKNSRTTNVIRNAIGGVGGQLFTSIFMFICRTYFIELLGATYLGINGLFSNILSMLSLAELGIGPAIVFSMYKPIAENDEVHIAKLMNFYKNAYRIVAIVVAAIGLCLLPFLEYLIKDVPDVENLKLIFVLILSNTVVSYFYAYKGSMLNADQKSYVTVIFRNIFSVIQNMLQIVVLITTGNFIIYLITQMITTFLANLVQAIYVDKKYPFLVLYKGERIDKTERADIMKRVRGMMMHKIGGFVLNSTDNLVISKFVGVVAVGIYSNYLMIINLIKTFVSQVSHSISASVGNLIASESEEKSYTVFNSVLLVYFWLYSFCTICFWVIFQPFIEWWIGDKYLLGGATLFLVLMNFYFTGIQECVNTFTNATGLFWETRYKPVFECIINLGVSVILAHKIGIVGVFAGTLVSYLCTFWINPILIFKKQFKKNVAAYFAKFIMYFAITAVAAISLGEFCNYIFDGVSLLSILARALICIIVPNLLYIVLFSRTKEFRYCFNLAKKTIKRGKIKNV